MNKQKNYISLLPSAVTLINGLCGFMAIVLVSTSPTLHWNVPLLKDVSMSYAMIAAWLVLIGMICDAMDGRIARASGYTSQFGAQLDSLCDVISFGVAPAVISCKIFTAKLNTEQFADARMAQFVGQLVILASAFYVLCAIVRLARFNVETEEDESAHMSFSGLPSPAAAGLIVSVALFHEVFIPRIPKILPFITHVPEWLSDLFLWALPVCVLVAGVLMVSRVPYVHLVNKLLRETHSFLALGLVIVALLVAIWNIFIALLLSFAVFVCTGPVLAIARKVKGGTG